MRVMMIWISLCALLLGVDITPKKIIEAGGNVQSIVLYGDKIVAGTSGGTIEVYKLSDSSLSYKVAFDTIKDFTGDNIPPKVFSVDMLEGTNIYLAVLQASSGARELVMVDNGVKKVLINASANKFITKAKFVDKNKILIALMSNELILWDIALGKELYITQPNPSHFSDFALNENKTIVASSCESGEITLSDVSSGKTIKVLSNGNVDNVYKVDFRNGKVLCAGQDRRGIVYDVKSGKFDRFDASFLIYAGALSPSSKLGAFAFNEQNDIVIFDLENKTKLHTLIGQKSTLNTIVFASEKELVSGSDDKFILIWRLP
jgi:WD40 repeat protein